jgi:tRNA pseudouridine55 synthase
VILAISKPPQLSSAQVLRDLQHKFAESKTFAPLLAQIKHAREGDNQKRQRLSNDQVFKMGHGGTLDPLASGVLIVGIGRGTKTLSDFLGCKKTYETVVLFGKNTDTYDIMGKVVDEAPTQHITKELVESQLAQFDGEMQQVPPMYSAIKIQGMKLYEYARSGKELPRQLESRTVDISECTLLDYYPSGEHHYRWPVEQASEEERAVARKLIAGAESTKQQLSREAKKTETQRRNIEKRKELEAQNKLPRQEKAAMHTHDLPTLEAQPADAPAARVRLTVSSGFYVRSFAYDLGTACSSYGTMAALVRSKQGDFTNIEPAPEGFVPTLTYEELEAGEDVWGPKVAKVLEEWVERHPPRPEDGLDDRDRSDRNYRRRRGGFSGANWRGAGQKRSWNDRRDGREPAQARRRNSSSELSQ